MLMRNNYATTVTLNPIATPLKVNLSMKVQSAPKLFINKEIRHISLHSLLNL